MKKKCVLWTNYYGNWLDTVRIRQDSKDMQIYNLELKNFSVYAFKLKKNYYEPSLK